MLKEQLYYILRTIVLPFIWGFTRNQEMAANGKGDAYSLALALSFNPSAVFLNSSQEVDIDSIYTHIDGRHQVLYVGRGDSRRTAPCLSSLLFVQKILLPPSVFVEVYAFIVGCYNK